MGIAFVTPETVTLELPDGDSITIRKRLTHGETDDMFARMRTGEREGQHVRVAAVNAYLLTWSSAVPMSPAMSDEDRIATLNNLDEDSFTEIEQAIRAHNDALDAKKKAQRTSGPISVSAA